MGMSYFDIWNDGSLGRVCCGGPDRSFHFASRPRQVLPKVGDVMSKCYDNENHPIIWNGITFGSQRYHLHSTGRPGLGCSAPVDCHPFLKSLGFTIKPTHNYADGYAISGCMWCPNHKELSPTYQYLYKQFLGETEGNEGILDLLQPLTNFY
jgi:hypothetical protein